MLNIFICEDNNILRQKYTKIIENYIIIENLDMKVALSTADPYNILNYLKSNDTTGVYFLDIDLNCDIDGLTLAKQIRNYDPRGFIIFITAFAKSSPLTFQYKIEAMDFIVKDYVDNISDRICECLLNSHNRFFTKVPKSEQFFTFKIDDRIIHENHKNILFFETSPNKHKIILHTVEKHLEFRAKFAEIETELDSTIFLRCHKSYIINTNNIKEIDTLKRIAVMLNGEVCLISFRSLNVLKNHLLKK